MSPSVLRLSAIANVVSATPPLPFLPPEAHGRRALLGLVVHAGGGAPGQAALAPFRALDEPIADLTGPMRYAELFPPDEEEVHPLAQVQTLFRDRFELATARAVLDGLDRSTAAFGSVQLRVLGGAMARVPAEATAFAHRDRRIMVNVGAMYEQPEEGTVHRSWVERLAAELSDGTTGRYVNFIGIDGADEARAAYPPATWERLAAIKLRHDPANVFRHNLNVPPAEVPS